MFADVGNDMTIAREEIFGPVLSIIPYEDVKADIKQRLSRTKMMAEYDSYVTDLREDAMIQYKVREVPMEVEVPDGPSPGTTAVGSDPVSPSFGVPDLGDELSITGNEEAETVKPLALPGGLPQPVPDEPERP